ncbi:RagB/SusD family nutrient uptake outer membrane protein [Arachidicoccus terrestris]|uniref:RagB/SusD family nutrient uptake outer membrane protein n=1 Tax=Arachidicoccus terrestris TaxID=2875539 RepID=UPI001CC39893|nr:RagB/SusD family nutrient uptake outer membrane protein [Arachidicoccus terrestris]UAY53795.1 RagB/SusD family nutrient uptake outer membrane protein [Arachidicoccus terrestris]
MKKYKLYISVALFSGCLFIGSCKKDFLGEELETERGMSFYQTDAGIKSLSTGTYYQVFKTPFSAEWIYCNTIYGVDEFCVGGDGSNAVWNDYDGGFKSIVSEVNSNTSSTNAQWDNLYIGIGDANLLIQNATASASTADEIKKVALGEGYFFRAYCYLRLVSQYGGVPLVTTPSTTVNLEFTRATPQEVYNQIIEDFKQAYELLPNSGAPAKITKDAAAHFLAKAYLYRASEINDSWNAPTKAADLAAIVPLCDEVIANHPLAADFAALWDYTEPDGANEQLPELILSAQFTADVSATGGNHQHIYFGGRYDDLAQMQRDVTGDRPYSRLRPSYYMYRVYDLVKDSRFWKSFRTKYRLNKASGGYYKNGDLGIIYIVNQPGDTRFSSYELNDVVKDPKTGKTIPNAYIAYPKAMTADGALNVDVRYPSLSKFFDGSRPAVNDTRGFRDIILARSAETYLIAAEAKIRLAKLGKGTYAEALPYINAVRNRAAYKSGEDRSVYYDGGGALGASTSGQDPNINSFVAENSYYESNNIPATTAATDLSISSTGALPASDNYIISKLGLSSDYDRMLALVLDERSRELAGEFVRWEDLSRTETLVPRVKAFNFQASANVQPFHELRPIPQTYLDGIQLNGSALTVEEKEAQQNPGF